jgi:hypothetical protein
VTDIRGFLHSKESAQTISVGEPFSQASFASTPSLNAWLVEKSSGNGGRRSAAAAAAEGRGAPAKGKALLLLKRPLRDHKGASLQMPLLPIAYIKSMSCHYPDFRLEDADAAAV